MVSMQFSSFEWISRVDELGGWLNLQHLVPVEPLRTGSPMVTFTFDFCTVSNIVHRLLLPPTPDYGNSFIQSHTRQNLDSSSVEDNQGTSPYRVANMDY
ncbi:hypothetical protein NP233_g6656 [Leucocoprinus birnbaumii]|uniref:Uncharacterized protein n=1 Tax=Leucocoprinus birnbaumii TaxID=56174 RepID=A0AAD5YVC2_9AGAR|nr:hypothetical protein NP233_g6656 [Leucocoprinus birnbaumii]